MSCCDCGHQGPDDPASRERPNLWSMFGTALVCAVCPVCLATSANLLSLLGISVSISEEQHELLLFAALSTSVATSAWRSWRRRSLWPIGIAAIGSSLVVAGHSFGDLHAMEWAGVALLLAGSLCEGILLRRHRPAAAQRTIA
jgi:hypothetical protein